MLLSGHAPQGRSAAGTFNGPPRAPWCPRGTSPLIIDLTGVTLLVSTGLAILHALLAGLSRRFPKTRLALDRSARPRRRANLYLARHRPGCARSMTQTALG